METKDCWEDGKDTQDSKEPETPRALWKQAAHSQSLRYVAAYLLWVLALNSFKKAIVPSPLALKDTVQTGHGVSKALWRRSCLDPSGMSPTTK